MDDPICPLFSAEQKKESENKKKKRKKIDVCPCESNMGKKQIDKY